MKIFKNKQTEYRPNTNFDLFISPTVRILMKILMKNLKYQIQNEKHLLEGKFCKNVYVYVFNNTLLQIKL